MVGRTLNHYEILEPLGAGGMGEVYRARDTTLERDVAIKVLPEDFAADEDRLARFEREAKLLASLNHANIAAIYGLEDDGDQRFIVMEVVEGETLAERITSSGPIEVDEALEIAHQIAEALEAAHENGVIHRDLKPANVKITPGGLVKVLDFGLARAAPTHESPPTSETPTVGVSDTLTTPGTILGTLQYMSPEQARGGEVDRRTDLWALGVVLYECLTGANPFNCESSAECIAALFSQDPDLNALPGATPAEVIALIRRCLRKDARQRQRDAGDCRLILEEAQEAISLDSPVESRVSAINHGRFRITDELCRTLDRSGFDALLPGWEMRFADNNRESDLLIVWLPSIGGDHTTAAWRELLGASPYRMIAVCPVGMEPDVGYRPVVSIENQFALIRALTAFLRTSLSPRKAILSGFSCGSTMALRCAAGDESGELFDGVLTIDADLQESDCFITRLFAGLDASSSIDVMKALHAISGSCGTMHEWLVLHQHMLECIDKVKSDLSPLIRQGIDLSAPFDGVRTGQQSPFVGFLRDALDHVPTVLCVFHDSAEQRRMIGEIRMMHMDTQCLGQKFTDRSLMFIPVADHTAMMSTERLLEHLDLIADAV